MSAAPPGAPAVTVYGYCAVPPARIESVIESGRAADLVDADGHFVIVYRGPSEDVIISARSGIVSYFMTSSGKSGRLGHGRDVATVACSARLRPGWNQAAVADYLIFGHPLGPATIHPEVIRLPGGVLVRVADQGSREVAAVPAASPGPGGFPYSPPGAVDALLAAVDRDLPDDCTLSMSGGLDSRLLLAACLATGRRPRLLISGVPGSFDREVATLIGRRLRLPATVTSVRAKDVAQCLPSIAAVTNGLIPAGNWAGIAHVRSVLPGDAPVLFGFNGEIARLCYGAHTGVGVLRTARSVPRKDRAVLLGQVFESPFAQQERRWLGRELRDALEPAAVASRLIQVLGAAPGGAFTLADRLYLENYGPQKLGSDLAAIEAYTPWRAPLFAPAFVDRVRSLPLRWRLGDRFHRYAIGQCCRPLLEFPEEGYGPRLSRSVPARYWLRGPRPAQPPFFLDGAIFQDPDLLGLLARHGEQLAGLVDPVLVKRLTTLQAAGPHRSSLFFRLLALALWKAVNQGQ